jgi:hypothetical protein
MFAVLTVSASGELSIEQAALRSLMVDEGLICRRQTGKAKLEFLCEGDASALCRFASRALLLAGVASLSLQRTDTAGAQSTGKSI